VLFASELAEALRLYAQRLGVAVSLEKGRTVVLALNGETLDLSRFVGTHRIQRIPKNDPRGRRHTSTATVALVDAGTAAHIELGDDDVRTDFYRGHGKGGQHRNKTSTAVRLTHLPTGTIVVMERGRSQAQNLLSARSELLRRLNAESVSNAASEVNERRGRQITTGERPTKQWTWNQQRDEVVHHASGKRYRMTDFLRGGLDD